MALAVGSFLACHHDDRTVDADREARRVVAEIVDADNRGDLETVMSLYADDAVLLPPGEPPVRGRGVIRQRYEAIFSSSTLALVGTVESLRVAGDLAVVRGATSGTVTSKTGGGELKVDDKYVMVLERSDAGRWLIAELMWNRARD